MISLRMDFLRMGFLVVVVGLVLTFVVYKQNPYVTKLPVGSADLSALQKKLDKLPPAEKQLVLDYVARSKGDYMPKKMAPLDYPYTAATFAEAIALQREYLVSAAKEDTRLQQRSAHRDEVFAPLRDVLRLRLLKREFVPLTSLAGADQGGLSVTLDGQIVRGHTGNESSPRLIVTYQLQNAGAHAITSFSGVANIYKAGHRLGDLQLFTCWVNSHEELNTSATMEHRCAGRGLDAEQDIVNMPESDMDIVWEPESIHFADGTALTAHP